MSTATDRAIKERHEHGAKLAAGCEKAARERAAADLETYRQERLRRWIGATGSGAGFDQAWPATRQEYASRGGLREQIESEMMVSGLYRL